MTDSLIPKLIVDFPLFDFKIGDDFRWSSDEKTIYYPEKSNDTASLLHELAHGILNHSDYLKDIQLIEMERDAWNYAVSTLGQTYSTTIDDESIQDALDSYRDWLHARSSCPRCDATGFQTKKQLYSCPACGQIWRVNEARLCGLKRYSVATRK